MPNPFSYPQELRDEGVRLVREEGRSLREVGKQLGVSYETVRYWVERAEKGSKGTDEQAEIRRLQKELRRTQAERDILKKAVAFFAREHEDR
jgi:transposase